MGYKLTIPTLLAHLFLFHKSLVLISGDRLARILLMLLHIISTREAFAATL
jgi:hypothetical protein